MAGDLELFATNEFKSMIRKAKKIGQVVAGNATDFAPKGWTGQLKRSIRASNPKVSNNEIIVSVSAGATSIKGEQYALKQHDVILRHYTKEGLKHMKGYSDFGTGKTREDRYWDGYAKKAKGSTRYATKYMTKGLEESDKDIDTILNS